MKHALLMSILPVAWLAACGGGGGGGAGADASAGAADASTSAADAAISTPDAPPPDAAPLALGAACSDGSACGSGLCIDGVCCDAACDSLCMSCRGADTGGSDGTCAPIAATTDPADECATELCATGTCDGAGACVVRDDENVCRASAGACDLVETCDGIESACAIDRVAAAGVPCGSYLCDGVSAACPTTCASDAACSANNVCVSGGCVPGRRAFTTSAATTGALGGLSGGDAFCQNLANLAGLRGAYRAWLSDASGSPSTRFSRSTVPYILPNGAVLAQSYDDLVDGSLGTLLDVTETGVTVPGNVPFTGTTPAGTAFGADMPTINNCSGWTSASASVHAMCGNSAGNDGTWTQSSNVGSPRQCNVLHRLYCFQQ